MVGMARASKGDEPVEQGEREAAPNPAWFKPLMIGFMLLGLVWVIVYYIGGSIGLPIPGIGAWNLVIGFGIAFIGFLMTTRWR
jgi:hypothetical protein